MRRWDGITDSMDMSLSKFREILKDREAWCVAVHRVTELEMTEMTRHSHTVDYSHLLYYGHPGPKP